VTDSPYVRKDGSGHHAQDSFRIALCFESRLISGERFQSSVVLHGPNLLCQTADSLPRNCSSSLSSEVPREF
ncbi:hypothetical protein AVEN_109779-1, partial [Araneus ventricosus]